MNAILLVAHGSKRPESNEEVFALADQLDRMRPRNMDIIHAAFLDMAQPSIPQGIAACVNDGATSITLLPYFLNSGRHVMHDIPVIVEETMKKFPGTTMRIGPHLGQSGLMAGLLAGIIQTLPPAETQEKEQQL